MQKKVTKRKRQEKNHFYELVEVYNRDTMGRDKVVVGERKRINQRKLKNERRTKVVLELVYRELEV